MDMEFERKVHQRGYESALRSILSKITSYRRNNVHMFNVMQAGDAVNQIENIVKESLISFTQQLGKDE